MKFSIEELYRCSRVEYCRATSITPGDLIRHLEAELKMLNISLDKYRNEYREGGVTTTDEQKLIASIIFEIQSKIEHKINKLRDIRLEFGTILS